MALSLALGLLAGWRCWHTFGVNRPDFGQIWFAARALLAGQDPYLLIGPGLDYDIRFRFFYPLTAAVAVIPLAPLSLQAACATFATLAGTCFAWALMRHGYAPLWGFFGGGMLIASQEAQWSPLLAAATVVPALGVVFAAKPTGGAAMFAARPSWWPIGAGLVLLAISLLMIPSWPASWLANIRVQSPAPGGSAFLMPITLGAGPLIAIALLRWRRVEARLLVAMACVPQSVGLYESVPLLLVPRGWRESVYLFLASHVLLEWAIRQSHLPDFDRLAAVGRVSVLIMYLPCVVMVLRRPNEGPMPAWLEQRIAAWPAWLKGSAPTRV